jgi:hypothetical protein
MTGDCILSLKAGCGYATHLFEETCVMVAMRISILLTTLLLVESAYGQGKVIQYNEDPVVDVPKGEEERYQQDLQECRDFARQTEGNKKSGVKTGRRVGVIAGAVGGAVTGEGAVKGAAIGGAAGGLSGRTAGAVQDSGDAGFVVRKCLDGRGWNVLDYDGRNN